MFVTILLVLFTAEILQPVQQHVIVPFTARIADVCVWLVNIFDRDVIASGKIIRSISNGFAVEIQPGCNGVEGWRLKRHDRVRVRGAEFGKTP